jgi:uncharacterized protein YgfB (UPF0149 family)
VNFEETLNDHLPAGVSLPEFHGSAAGLICVQGATEDDAPALARDLAELLGVARNAFDPTLVDLVAGTAAALDAPDFAFEPMLPDDEETLPARVAALADWCGAFVSAFAESQPVLEPEGREALEDLEAIAGVAYEEDDEDAAEIDFAAVLEHVRVAVLLLHDEIRAPGHGTG